MKQYMKPASEVIDLVLGNNVMVQTSIQGGIQKNERLTDDTSSGSLSREKSGGFGSGMWEDMK